MHKHLKRITCEPIAVDSPDSVATDPSFATEHSMADVRDATVTTDTLLRNWIWREMSLIASSDHSAATGTLRDICRTGA